jgi:hypothetical protein
LTNISCQIHALATLTSRYAHCTRCICTRNVLGVIKSNIFVRRVLLFDISVWLLALSTEHCFWKLYVLRPFFRLVAVASTWRWARSIGQFVPHTAHSVLLYEVQSATAV